MRVGYAMDKNARIARIAKYAPDARLCGCGHRFHQHNDGECNECACAGIVKGN